jgi:hypothetical protein
VQVLPGRRRGEGLRFTARASLALGEQGGHLRHIGERRVRLDQVSGEERRPLDFRSPFSA